MYNNYNSNEFIQKKTSSKKQPINDCSCTTITTQINSQNNYNTNQFTQKTFLLFQSCTKYFIIKILQKKFHYENLAPSSRVSAHRCSFASSSLKKKNTYRATPGRT